MKPLIGIIGQVEPLRNRLFLDRKHMEKVSKAGGIPVVFSIDSTPEDVIDSIDGLLLIEGPDVHPRFYGEDPSTSLKHVDVVRDNFEINLVKKALDRGVPILGIGRGMHVINVALGGTLYQDVREIPKAIKHDWELGVVDPFQRVHGVRIKTKSKLYEILKDELDIEGTNEVYIQVNSFHHQAVKRVGEGLRPVAYSVDGIIEGIEAEEGFIIGVQWQAEYLKEMERLYKAFVEAANEYRRGRLELKRIEIEAKIREELAKEQDESHHSSETSDNLPDTNQT